MEPAMIQVTPQMRILAAVEPVDFRSGIDGLARICRQKLREDPFSGSVFVFCNRRRTAIKILVYDSQGYWICHKRLSEGKFRWWPGGEVLSELAAHELLVLLWNGDPRGARAAPAWKKIAHSG
jgi:transposase